MSNKELKANSSALFILIVSIIILIVGIIFSITTSVSDDEISDMELIAQDLVEANFDTASYFGISSLSAVDGYKAEDYPAGAAPCDANVFSSYSDLSDFIKSTYAPTSALILLSSEINGTKRYFDYNGQLCMAVVEPDLTYNKDWSKVKIKLTDIEKKTANINITMNLKDSQETETIVLTMSKYGDKWLLNNLEY